MPEKRTGVFDIIKGVFKSKKESCGDIVCQAEAVISSYISCRRYEMLHRYKKKNRFMSLLMLGASAVALYLIYKIAA